MFITKKHISRRTVLRGMGAAVALPFLESMVPAQTPLGRPRCVPEPSDVHRGCHGWAGSTEYGTERTFGNRKRKATISNSR